MRTELIQYRYSLTRGAAPVTPQPSLGYLNLFSRRLLVESNGTRGITLWMQMHVLFLVEGHAFERWPGYI